MSMDGITNASRPDEVNPETIRGSICTTRKRNWSTSYGAMGHERLHRWYRFPWGPEGTAYYWLIAFVMHDSNQDRDIRKALEGLLALLGASL